MKVAGLVQLRIFKRELAGFYKDLLKVVLSDPISKNDAMNLERKVNELILSVNDSIDEVEIKISELEANE